jgi:DNA-binding NtrC family response regulator
MNKPIILIVDDEVDICQTVEEILTDEGYECITAKNGDLARKAANQNHPDLILLDIWMPDIDGISLLKEWKEENAIVAPVIMMSGHGTIETAVEATRLGAYDFLEKPLSLAKLLLTVERALEAHRLQQENVTLRTRFSSVNEPTGKSAVILHLKDQIKRLAQHETNLLITGEAGSGKELFARYLHLNSSRREGPFIDVGVGLIAPENSAIELFGREEGQHVHRGLLEQAHGGTLFLNGIDEMDSEAQLRLLSALESKSFLRVGGSEQIKTNIRVVASSTQPLAEQVQEGSFREELYYLLNVVSIETPPLRKHTEDISELLNFYVEHFVTREKLPFRKFSVAAQNFLRNYPWHGNVRELKNLVQRLLILGTGDEIDLDETKNALGGFQISTTDSTLPEFFELPLKEARDQFEKAYLQHHLDNNNGNIAQLAAAIGMERTHLYRKLHAANIKFR